MGRVRGPVHRQGQNTREAISLATVGLTLDVQFFPTFSGAANGESGIRQFLISLFPVSPNDSRCSRNRRMKTKDVKIPSSFLE